MKPNPQFIQMITMLQHQNRQKAITNSDYIKHINHSVSFYSISQYEGAGLRINSRTEPFSDMVMIEITKNADQLIIGTDRNQEVYQAVYMLEYIDEGPVLRWAVQDSHGETHTVMKAMSPEGVIQIMIHSCDETKFLVHNVCELPNL